MNTNNQIVVKNNFLDGSDFSKVAFNLKNQSWIIQASNSSNQDNDSLEMNDFLMLDVCDREFFRDYLRVFWKSVLKELNKKESKRGALKKEPNEKNLTKRAYLKKTFSREAAKRSL